MKTIEQRKLKMNRYIFLTIFLSLSGCATKPPTTNLACAYVVDLPKRFENCAGTIDVRFHYVNGSARDYDKELHRTNTALSKHYVPQNHTNSCFAAALEIALSYFGFNQTEEDYLDALGDECFVARGRPATFSQVVFSATRALNEQKRGTWWFDGPNNPVSSYLNNVLNDVAQYKYTKRRTVHTNKTDLPVYIKGSFCHSPDGLVTTSSVVWVNTPSIRQILKWTGNDLFGNHYPQWLSQPDASYSGAGQVNLTFTGNLYRPLPWTRSGGKSDAGGIAPVADVGDLVRHFENGAPIVAGLTNEWSGHVVVIDQIWYIEENRTNLVSSPPELKALLESWGGGTTLTRVRVMDPATPEHRYREIDGNSFLENAGFIFAVYGG